jgi:hypothetical protein
MPWSWCSRVGGERGFHVRDVVLGRHLAFDIGDVVGDRGEAAVHLTFEISEAALDGREDAVERRLALLGRLLLCGHIRRVYYIGRLGTSGPTVWMSSSMKIVEGAHGNWKRGSV